MTIIALLEDVIFAEARTAASRIRKIDKVDIKFNNNYSKSFSPVSFLVTKPSATHLQSRHLSSVISRCFHFRLTAITEDLIPMVDYNYENCDKALWISVCFCNNVFFFVVVIKVICLIFHTLNSCYHVIILGRPIVRLPAGDLALATLTNPPFTILSIF